MPIDYEYIPKGRRKSEVKKMKKEAGVYKEAYQKAGKKVSEMGVAATFVGVAMPGAAAPFMREGRVAARKHGLAKTGYKLKVGDIKSVSTTGKKYKHGDKYKKINEGLLSARGGNPYKKGTQKHENWKAGKI
jgi:hypothetical protein